ncbi:DUF308 domain-containing protein [Methanobacterium alcaliphilum]|uniref:DUF308 domain-containing protein n=1 Tax=Methanobacterium alcaliphilum TaxID=392018 RepID=UPI00200B9A6D|nr:DUF308 domain-containing protein [Methanobacterium alcaliphilum]MCK9150876.1 DUF308 domain-containing protein [Methanobacterium alcaliphilum]
MSNHTLLGVLTIILGILVMVFPLFSVFTVSVLAGLGVLFLGIWLLSLGFGAWAQNKGLGVAYLILGIIAIIIGLGLFGNVLALSFLASLWLYFGGFFLIIGGIMGFIARDATIHKGSNALLVIMGILYIILGTYALNPLYLAIIIGISLVIDGIALLFVNPIEIAEPVE